MILAIDYDGVVADTNALKAHWITAELGLRVPPWRCDRSQCVPIIGEEQYKAMIAMVYGKELSSQANPVAGVVRGIGALTAQGWQVIIVTARNADRIRWAKLWLKTHTLGKMIRDVISADGTTKGAIVERTQALAILDDDIRHLTNIRIPAVQRFHFAPGLRTNSIQREGIVHVRNWKTFVDILTHKELANPSREFPSQGTGS